jgi:hypothetical protein
MIKVVSTQPAGIGRSERGRRAKSGGLCNGPREGLDPIRFWTMPHAFQAW